MSAPFKPSQVVLNTLPMPPLVGTMGHAECEHAASLLVLTCATNGDTWAPVTATQVGEAIESAVEAGTEPWSSLSRNPFFRPDFMELVNRGFAQKTSEESPDEAGVFRKREALPPFCRGDTIEFTAKGIEAMGRWVRE